MVAKKEKVRLDVAVHERGLTESREKARGMIMAGEVLVNGKAIDKPGTRVRISDDITLTAKPRFVSRGGEKLEGALQVFDVSPAGLICADVGASTGGFTDCLIQNGATRVYAIDVGYGQLAYTLRQNPRVVTMERTNARYIEALEDQPDLVVIDASFISLRLLIPVIKSWLHHKSQIVALIKPQFEAGRDDVGKGGVIRDAAIHANVIHASVINARDMGFVVRDLSKSNLKGPAGNVEFFIHLSCSGQALSDAKILEKVRQLTDTS